MTIVRHAGTEAGDRREVKKSYPRPGVLYDRKIRNMQIIASEEEQGIDLPQAICVIFTFNCHYSFRLVHTLIRSWKSEDRSSHSNICHSIYLFFFFFNASNILDLPNQPGQLRRCNYKYQVNFYS
jgi:hypothetical protein